ncbi:hypothetical protein VCHA37P193_600003 [Vibrio chagasii]|nr:hypothetical protein VCHA37P193_600003 [Vibrio chagasii]
MQFVTKMNTMSYLTLHYWKFNMIASSKFRSSKDNVKRFYSCYQKVNRIS